MIGFLQNWLFSRDSLGFVADLLDFVAASAGWALLFFAGLRARIVLDYRKLSELEAQAQAAHERVHALKSEQRETMGDFRDANRRRHGILSRIPGYVATDAFRRLQSGEADAGDALEQWWESERESLADINGQLGEWNALFAIGSGFPSDAGERGEKAGQARALAVRHLLIAANANPARGEWASLAEDLGNGEPLADGDLPAPSFYLPAGLPQREARLQVEAMDNLAWKHLKAGEYWTAYLIADKASRIAARNLPTHDTLLLDAERTKAYGLSFGGHSARALAIARPVWEACRAHADLGERHPDTLASAHQVAQILDRFGRYEEALTIAQPAWEAYRAHADRGERHPNTLAIAYQVAQILDHLGRYEEALASAQPAWEARRAHADLGERHPDTLASAHQVAQILDRFGRYEEVLTIAQPAWEAYRAHADLGERHPSTLASAHQVAQILDHLGRYEEALAIAQPAWEACRAHADLGSRHPGTLASAYQVAQILHNLGRHEEAKACAEEAYAVAKEALAPAHLVVVELRALLDEISK